jgi:primosomal protein N'
MFKQVNIFSLADEEIKGKKKRPHYTCPSCGKKTKEPGHCPECFMFNLKPKGLFDDRPMS